MPSPLRDTDKAYTKRTFLTVKKLSLLHTGVNAWFSFYEIIRTRILYMPLNEIVIVWKHIQKCTTTHSKANVALVSRKIKVL
jgi:hypothetical protein